MARLSSKAGMDAWPAEPRRTFWGCGGLIVGLVLGGLLMLLGLIALAPRPQVAAPSTAGNSGNLSISMDDTYLTHIITKGISQSTTMPITMTNIQAEILPGDEVKLSAYTQSGLPVNAQLTAIAQLRIEGGQLVMHIASAYVGGLPLPAAVVTAIEQPINTSLAQTMSYLLPPGYAVSNVNTTAHRLQMTISQQ